MKNRVLPISFPGAVLGVCSGTAVFPQLVRHSFGRALWHLILLSALLAIAITAGRGYLFGRNLQPCANAVNREFGEFSIGAVYGDIRPALAPEQSRSIMLPWETPLQVIYVANFDQPIPKVSAPLGVLFTPNQFYWFRLNGDATVSLFQMNAINSTIKPVIQEDVATILKKLDNVAPMLKLTDPIQFKANDQSLLDSIQFTFCTITYIGTFFGMILLALITVGLFTLIFALSGKLRGTSQASFAVRPGEMMVAGIYAGFPPMLIGTLFSALDLPFLDYNTIYMFGMACYLMFAVARIQFSRLPMPPKPGDFQ